MHSIMARKHTFGRPQILTHHDYDDSNAINEAFLFVVSGMEDMLDAEKGPRALDLSEMANGMSEEEALKTAAMYNVYNKVFWRSSMSSETASNGLYITTKPRLGLAVAAGAV